MSLGNRKEKNTVEKFKDEVIFPLQIRSACILKNCTILCTMKGYIYFICLMIDPVLMFEERAATRGSWNEMIFWLHWDWKVENESIFMPKQNKWVLIRLLVETGIYTVNSGRIQLETLYFLCSHYSTEVCKCIFVPMQASVEGSGRLGMQISLMNLWHGN